MENSAQEQSVLFMDLHIIPENIHVISRWELLYKFDDRRSIDLMDMS